MKPPGAGRLLFMACIGLALPVVKLLDLDEGFSRLPWPDVILVSALITLFPLVPTPAQKPWWQDDDDT